MYVYCTPEVLENSAIHNVGGNLEAVVARLEQGDRTLLCHLFDLRYPYWKRNLRNNIRLVGELRLFGEMPVLVLFGLWPRGSYEYTTFLAQKETPDYQARVRRQVPDELLRDWLEQRQEQEEQSNQANQLPPLPEELFNWTQISNDPPARERLVLETGEWVRQVQALDDEQRRQLYQAVEQLVSDVEGQLYQECPPFYPETNVRCWQEGSLHLAFSLVRVLIDQTEAQSPLLIGVYDHPPDQEEQFVLGRETGLFGAGAQHPDILTRPQPLEVWKRYARRAYPDYVLADEHIWLEMQASAEGNLALSAEEEEILQSTSMPLLISGRAGSGKSLMLYYRFADYCSYYLQLSEEQRLPYQPLFLTYSSALVEQAWNRVSDILRLSHRYRLNNLNFLPQEIQRCRVFFNAFQDYLLNCLPPERRERYRAERYINFHPFRCWYYRNPELAWHVIRTLIKGYEVSDYLDPDSYQELPRADRSVSQEDFKYIYERIWPGYRERTTREGYWDDQDLVRDVLKNGNLQPIHPVIFCDEVQDFTRIELNFIFSLSPWGQYKLDWGISHLPYAFAGDPLQTINPTGFRWRALKSHLYEHVRGYLLVDLRIEDPKELQNNYRSGPRITRFSNLVNLWRRVLSDQREIRREIQPQKPWRPQEQGAPVQRFILNGPNQDLIPRELQAMLKSSTGTVCILPCSVGEELNYVQQDPELRQIFAQELQQNSKPPLLQTVTAVKGMEFKKVILYKFGDHYQRNFSRDLIDYAEGRRDEISLALHYFLNRLYVGITRPIAALAILDTAAGWQQFWEPALEVNFWLNHPCMAEDRAEWAPGPPCPPLLDVPVRGMGIQYWTATNDQEVLEVATQFLRQGVQEANPTLLADALVLAQQLNRLILEQECQAWLFKIEGRYLEAGQQFLRLQRLAVSNSNPKREAWECFWQARAWTELQQYGPSHFVGCRDIPDWSPLVELMVALQQKPARSLECFQQVVRVRDWLRPQVLDSSDRWKVCVEHFLAELSWVIDHLSEFCPDAQAQSQFLEQTCDALAGRLAFLGQDPAFSKQYFRVLGDCHFHRREWQKAVAVWDQAGQNEHSRYYRCKIQLEPLPHKVRWLAKDRQDATVVGIWQEAGRPLTGEWADYVKDVLTSLERLQQWPLVMRILIQQRTWDRLWETVQKHPHAWQRGHDYELVASLARDPVIHSRWNEQEKTSLELREFLRQVVTSARLEHPYWLQPLEVGLAYERLGAYRDALRFYWPFATGRFWVSEQQRSQIQQHWLRTHQRYQANLEAEGRPTDRLREDFRRLQDRWGQPAGEVEPRLPEWDPWAHDFLEYPSPVQSWLLQRNQTETQIQLKAQITRELDRLTEAQLAQVLKMVRSVR